ncbi:MAG: putative LPS assembly protein LptD [Prolixibacteraceae bacterium]
MRISKYIFILSFLLGITISAFSQNEVMLTDSALVAKGLTVINDSISAPLKKKKSIIESPIDYDASDSIAISMENGQQIVHLYGGAKIKYGSIELTAAYISVNFDTKEMFARGVEDSTGTVTGKPHFMEGTEEFDCSTLRYNFISAKGFTEDVVTKQEDGTVRSARAKMMSKDIYCMVDGKYSTCDAEHPHFYLNMTKGKVIKDKAIITGRSYLVLEDFPIYFPFLPYGFIPTFNKSYSSGVIIPSYGEERQYGFYLKNGGFYWAASDYFDLKVTGDAYTSGKWALNGETSYRLRYKFSGNFRLSYSKSVTGTKGFGQTSIPNFSVTWSHSQDAKANPSQTISANVNFSSSGYDKENSYEDPTKSVQNSKSSTVSYRKTFQNTPFSLTASMRASQNTKNQTVSVTLPSMTLNMKSIQPFKAKKSVGGKKWYDDFKLSYSAQIENKINTTEAELFKTPFSQWEKSVKHNLPITWPSFKILNYINVVPSISYNESWYFDYTEKYWTDGYYVTDTEFGTQKWVSGEVKEISKDGFKRNYSGSLSLGSSTTLYGLYNMKNPNWRLKAIQHKIDPSLSFSYNPDFSDVDNFPFNEMVQVDSLGNYEKYNIFGLSSPQKSGSINFGMDNRVEMKLLNDKDTTATEKFKKVAILDNFGIRSSYNLRADSLNLNVFSINARTKIAGTTISITGSVDPYQLNDRGDRRINQFMWNDDTRKGLGRLGRLTNISTGYGFSYSSDKFKKKQEAKRKEQGLTKEEGEVGFSNYTPFNMPWRISANYTFNYSNTTGTPRLTQSVNLNGGIDLTTKWKTTFSSGFDFVAMKMTHTNVSITRNLHCWTMSFNFAPISTTPFYTFTLSANASMLKDLKVNKTDRDYY